MQLIDLLAPTYAQMLGALRQWLAKADAQEDIDGDALMAARLAPDMFPLSTQVRFVLVQAIEGVHRLRGEALPARVTELLDEGRGAGERPGTLAEAIARIDEVLATLDADAASVPAVDPNGRIVHDLPNGMTFDLSAAQYARDWALPQFYFHLMSAYAILRHAGVDLGKVDYVAHMLPYLRRDEAAG